MASLPYSPQYASQASFKPRVLKAAFGDGYEQRSADGVNTNRERWTLTFTLAKPDFQTLLAFFSGMGAVDAFEWIPKGQTQEKKYVCESWSYQVLSTQMYRLNAEIYQSFEP